MSDKKRFPAALADALALQLVTVLRGCCQWLEVAGSLRRKKDTVGDIEIIYVAKFGVARKRGEMFPEDDVDLSQIQILGLLDTGILKPRLSKTGSPACGPKNKLLYHVESGIPIDLFATTLECRWNYLVCRTGPMAFNVRVATRAHELGFKWHPTKSGFSSPHGWRTIASEEDLFDFLGWEYLAPWERDLVPRRK